MIGNGIDLQTVIWGLMALLITGGAVAASRQRARDPNARGPGILLSLLIWGALIAFVVFLVQGVEFWAALVSLFR